MENAIEENAVNSALMIFVNSALRVMRDFPHPSSYGEQRERSLFIGSLSSLFLSELMRRIGDDTTDVYRIYDRQRFGGWRVSEVRISWEEAMFISVYMDEPIPSSLFDTPLMRRRVRSLFSPSLSFDSAIGKILRLFLERIEAAIGNG